jgi:hypothetical protein
MAEMLNMHLLLELKFDLLQNRNCVGGVMVGVLALSVLDRGVDPRSGQTKGKDYKIGICCFSTKQNTMYFLDVDKNQDKTLKLSHPRDYSIGEGNTLYDLRKIFVRGF